MRLIDADMADRTVGSDEFREQLDMMETVDAEPVVHARWERKIGEFECSACKKCSEYIYDYCPNCGAKMDGKVKE